MAGGRHRGIHDNPAEQHDVDKQDQSLAFHADLLGLVKQPDIPVIFD